VPNLIGYGRFVLLFLCPVFVYSEEYWYWYTICYAASQLLDVIDGMAARKFDQCSRFGAALDMVCDRTSNALNFFILASVYP
jgi:CDP-diacylglycerol--inositol 3-phosphatidyltransferase